MFVAVIGAGWSGCHLACELAKEGHSVILFDRKNKIFDGTSGNFGIRLHRGPHYPRSRATRDNCQKTFHRFRDAYNDLVVDHDYAIYANGAIDSQGFPSKVSDETFEKVCQETPGCEKLDLDAWGLQGLGCAYNLDEPSVSIGARARSHFEEKLKESGVSVVLGVNVLDVKQAYISTAKKPVTQIQISSENGPSGKVLVHRAINCTGFEAFLPEELGDPTSPIHFEFTYQTCIALRFKDNAPTSSKPMSFIVMDGWFPCLMPAISDNALEGQPQTDYILTHGLYTILGSFDTPGQARKLLEKDLRDDFVATEIRDKTVAEMCRFWPQFASRFSYEGWYGSVLAKPKCPTEFRSSFAFESKGVIHVFPGKVSNVLDAADEAMQLLNSVDKYDPSVHEERGCRFVKGGVFSASRAELRRQTIKTDRCTSNLQTFTDVQQKTVTETPLVLPLDVQTQQPDMQVAQLGAPVTHSRMIRA